MDPSGYKYGPSDYEREQINGEHTYYNWEMAWKLGGNRTPFANAFEWGRTVGGYWYNWATGKYDNSFSGSSISASSFSSGVVPYLGGMLSPEATGRVIDALNSLNSQTTASNSLTGRSWNLPLMQARGFDDHIFQYNRATGLFYAPWTDLQVDPLAILAQSMRNTSTSGSRQSLSYGRPEAFTHISESSTTWTFGVVPYIVHQTTAAGHIKGKGPVRIKNGVRLNDVVSRRGPFFVKAMDNGWMVGAGNFSLGVTDRMFTTSFRSVSNGYAGWDSQYVSVTNQYQLNWKQLGYIAAVAAFPVLFETATPYLIPVF